MPKLLPRILSGWKDIANYLNKGVRTTQRYERELGLPVHRPCGRFRGSVMATKAGLDSWIAGAPTRKSFDNSPVQSSSILYEFRSNLDQMAQLRGESAESRQALALLRKDLAKSREALLNSVQSLGANIERAHQELDKRMSGLYSLEEATVKLPPPRKKLG